MISAITISIIFFLWYLKLKKNEDNIFSTALVVIYMLSFIASIYMSGKEDNVLFLPSIFLVLLLVFFIVPFKNVGVKDILKFDNICYIKTLGTVFNVILVSSFCYFSYYAIQTLQSGRLSTLRLETDFQPYPATFFTPIISNFAAIFYFPLFLFFYSFINEKLRSQRIIYLISSLSYTVLTLSYAGRDGITYWLMNFAIFYFLFRHNIDSKSKRVIKKIFITIGSLIFVLFLVISVARFIDGGLSDGLIDPILSYLGQQLGNFSDGFEFRAYDGTIFPGIKYKVLGFTPPDLDSYYYNHNFFEESRSFGFFLKSFLWYYGIGGVVCISLIFNIICYHLKKKINDIYSFLILLTLYQIPLQGVFYYRQGVGGVDVPYSIFIIICLFLGRYSRKSSNQI